MATPVAIRPYYLYAFVEKFPVQVMPGYRNALPTPWSRVGARGAIIPEKRISPEQIYTFTRNGSLSGQKKVYHLYRSSLGEETFSA